MNRYLEARKRICTGRPPMSDAEIIEELDEEIGRYRNRIVQLETENGMRKEDYRRLSIEKAELDTENEALTAKVDSLSEENKKLKADKKVIIINSDTYMAGRMEENEHLRQTLDEILSVPSKKTEIRLHTGVDGTRMMEWRINGGTWIDD